ncbi:hypothetical protein FD723_40365 (plasmid) [Nostoc sp. C052]|uniref:hypothetical protein n=1 Tax=Nostoc sp. C052 TaxID=2576902 RepID=UPI0015C35EC7|nr:hypothetical protein [Nostoc sp. C052]QLE46469.1 hypothetical protein FD723_40365 [Nostoc sp. C052]
MVQELKDIQVGTWYWSNRFHPPIGQMVLCCFFGPHVFWLDYIHDFGDRRGLMWVSQNVDVDRTDRERNPFSWQIPMLPEFETQKPFLIQRPSDQSVVSCSNPD